MRGVSRKDAELQVALVERLADLLQVALVHARQHAVPDVRRVEPVAVPAAFEIPEDVHLTRLEQSQKRVGQDGDPIDIAGIQERWCRRTRARALAGNGRAGGQSESGS